MSLLGVAAIVCSGLATAFGWLSTREENKKEEQRKQDLEKRVKALEEKE